MEVLKPYILLRELYMEYSVTLPYMYGGNPELTVEAVYLLQEVSDDEPKEYLYKLVGVRVVRSGDNDEV